MPIVGSHSRAVAAPQRRDGASPRWRRVGQVARGAGCGCDGPSPSESRGRGATGTTMARTPSRAGSSFPRPLVQAARGGDGTPRSYGRGRGLARKPNRTDVKPETIGLGWPGSALTPPNDCCGPPERDLRLAGCGWVASGASICRVLHTREAQVIEGSASRGELLIRKSLVRAQPGEPTTSTSSETLPRDRQALALSLALKNWWADRSWAPSAG